MDEFELVEVSRDQLRRVVNLLCEPCDCDGEYYVVSIWHEEGEPVNIYRSSFNQPGDFEDCRHFVHMMDKLRLDLKSTLVYEFEVWRVVREHDEQPDIKRPWFRSLLDADCQPIVDVDGVPVLIGAEVASLNFPGIVYKVVEVHVMADAVWVFISKDGSNHNMHGERPSRIQVIAW